MREPERELDASRKMNRKITTGSQIHRKARKQEEEEHTKRQKEKHMKSNRQGGKTESIKTIKKIKRSPITFTIHQTDQTNLTSSTKLMDADNDTMVMPLFH